MCWTTAWDTSDKMLLGNGWFLRIFSQSPFQITKKFDQVNAGDDSVFWSIVEYAVIKSPLGTMILSSFVFSFSRILNEFGFIAILYLTIP
jgi:hypothetical protein